MWFLFYIILAVVFVEAVTELVSKSLIFSPLREFLFSRSKFIKKLLSCGYCTSVWVAITPALYLTYWFFDGRLGLDCAALFILTWMVVHRLANYLHNFNDKHLDKYYDSRLRHHADKK